MNISLLISYALAVLTITFLVSFLYQVIFYIISLRVKRNDIVDVAWGGGFLVIVFFWLIIIPSPSWTFVLATLLISVWGVRLSYHIWNRYMSKQEDRRYVEMGKDWKWKKTRSFFQVFVLQGALMSVVVLPATLHANMVVSTALPFVFIGLFLWCFGFYFQVLGDYQLKQFIENKKNEGMMKEGLWSKTRHPNYFGEICMWWGIFLITLSAFHIVYILVAVIGPVVITLLLRYVSGVPMLEKHWQEKYGKEFEDYKDSVPMLIPDLKTIFIDYGVKRFKK